MLDRRVPCSLSPVDSIEDLIPRPSLLLIVLLTEGVDELMSFPGRRALVRTVLKPRADGDGEISAAEVSIKEAGVGDWNRL